MSSIHEQHKRLVAKTRTLLAKRKTSYRAISEGAGVGLEWLHKFAQGHIALPSADKAQRVHDFLSGSGSSRT